MTYRSPAQMTELVARNAARDRITALHDRHKSEWLALADELVKSASTHEDAAECVDHTRGLEDLFVETFWCTSRDIRDAYEGADEWGGPSMEEEQRMAYRGRV